MICVFLIMIIDPNFHLIRVIKLDGFFLVLWIIVMKCWDTESWEKCRWLSTVSVLIITFAFAPCLIALKIGDYIKKNAFRELVISLHCKVVIHVENFFCIMDFQNCYIVFLCFFVFSELIDWAIFCFAYRFICFNEMVVSYTIDMFFLCEGYSRVVAFLVKYYWAKG
jgi:hypothetical protein